MTVRQQRYRKKNEFFVSLERSIQMTCFMIFQGINVSLCKTCQHDGLVAENRKIYVLYRSIAINNDVFFVLFLEISFKCFVVVIKIKIFWAGK